jgi:hypothetical protein
LNEKLKIEPALDPDSPETRTRSDVAPKLRQESGSAARHISGLRPAVHLPAAPSVPPPPLTPADLLEEGWDVEDEDSGPTLLDSHGSVPPELVARARALHDPLGEARDEREEREPETREVGTREVPTRAFSRDEAPTGEMPTVLNPLPAPATSDDDDGEVNHDDFPTRQTPMGLQEALLAYPLPSDSHRGLHETFDSAPPAPPSDDSMPDLPSSPSLGPTIAAPIAPRSPLSPLRSRITLSAQSPMRMHAVMPMQAPMSPDETAQMPNRPALRLDDLSPMPPAVEPSSISQISQISQLSSVSNASYPSSSPMALMYPTPTSITGAPLPPANTVRFAFLKNLSPNNDPPLNKLLVVGAISFFATLVLSSFIAWVVVLVRH